MLKEEIMVSESLPCQLWLDVKTATAHASDCEALKPLSPNWELIEQNGIQFLVKMSPNLAAKNNLKQQDTKTISGREFNPFLPYEADLFVGNLSDTHLCLLNKFNVVDHHLLIVTREFEEQETLLKSNDFEAITTCLCEIDGLVLYNSGKAAGGTQRHRHLHLLPLPIANGLVKLLPEQIITTANFENGMGTFPDLPFKHAITHLKSDWFKTPSQILSTYHQLLSFLKVPKLEDNSLQTTAYNLLITKNWMMMVVREQPSLNSIAVNALGFAGMILLQNDQQMQFLKEHSPIMLLSQVALSKF